MNKRKHRIVVDVSFKGPVTERYAAKALQLVLADADKDRSLGHWPTEIVKTEAKEGSRTFEAERAKGFRLGEASERYFESRLGAFAGYQAQSVTDNDGYLLEAAHQAGAVFLNDDATIYAFKQEDLLRLIRCALVKDFSALWGEQSSSSKRLWSAWQRMRQRWA